MPDITKCTNARCVAKSDCYRFTSVENYGNQYYDIFVPDVNVLDGFRCDMLIQESGIFLIHGKRPLEQTKQRKDGRE